MGKSCHRAVFWAFAALYVLSDRSVAFNGSPGFWIDQIPPPALSAFDVVAALDTAQAATVTVTLPSTTHDYQRIDIRYLAGATPPAAACNNGTVFKTYNVGGFVSESFDYALTASATYSYRVCIYDKQGNLTASNTKSSAVTSKACAGVMKGSYCWYVALPNTNCNDACTTHGGGDLVGTRDYVGSAGTDANCQLVMNLLGAPGTATADSSCLIAAGCTYDTAFGYNNRRRCSNMTTTLGAGNFSTTRACACNN